MDSVDLDTRNLPVRIAPTPAGGNGCDKPQPPKAFSCMTCARRKVKCDKATPTCSTCRKAKLECAYQVPQPRARRKLTRDVFEKLARYEQILHEHGLLDGEDGAASSASKTPGSDRISLNMDKPDPLELGKLLSGQGKSRYIQSRIWRSLEEHMEYHYSDSEEDTDGEADDEGLMMGGSASDDLSDPFTGAFVASSPQGILRHHPSHQEAMVLWEAHAHNVEPICKILHLPSAAQLVDRISKQSESASRAEECLVFSIYHFAVVSMTEEDCTRRLQQPRAALLQRYHLAARQALINASFLKTTDFTVLQAYTLFLMASRNRYDAHTMWIMTGSACRIGQRMGLHRDGTKLGLPPFEVLMRRRLFFQLLPLDGQASVMVGAGMPRLPEGWDVQMPPNLNDEDIWPGMESIPESRTGATEMIFWLSRSCLGSYFIKAWDRFKTTEEADVIIREAETEVEEKYIRYCDLLEPLHVLTTGMSRAGVTVMRLRVGLCLVREGKATDEVRREVFHHAQKILDTDAAITGLPGLERFRWHVRPLSLWGTLESLSYTLTTLWQRSSLVSRKEADAAWNRLDVMYRNHGLVESKRTLYVALGRVALKAWDMRSEQATTTTMGSDSMPEPLFVAGLRERSLKRKLKSQEKDATVSAAVGAGDDAIVEMSDLVQSGPGSAELGGSLGVMDLDTTGGSSVSAEDWAFWEQLIESFQQNGA